jgi:dihydroorotate dehydrogenase electron transfer subunit
MNYPSINHFAKQIRSPIINKKKAGPYFHISFEIGEIVKNIRPGNFVAISVGDTSSAMVLRRAYAIYRIIDKTPISGVIELVVAPHGSGSKWLAAQEIGTEIDMTVPLGKAFSIPTEPANALLVGGGYGSAPLFGLAEILKARGCKVDMVLGASTAAKIYSPLEGKRSVNSLTLTTDDGSAGIPGRISEALPKIIRAEHSEVIYSCGPMPMLSAVAKVANEFELPHQCAVEESMACGIGVCMTCVIPVRDISNNPSGIRMARSCIEGPVMDGASIIWDRQEMLDKL